MSIESKGQQEQPLNKRHIARAAEILGIQDPASATREQWEKSLAALRQTDPDGSLASFELPHGIEKYIDSLPKKAVSAAEQAVEKMETLDDAEKHALILSFERFGHRIAETHEPMSDDALEMTAQGIMDSVPSYLEDVRKSSPVALRALRKLRLAQGE